MKTKALLSVLFAFAFCLSGSAADQSKVIYLNLDGAIHAITAEYIEKGIDYAIGENADLVVIQLQTPGGVVESTRTIITKMVNSPVPVVVYVAPGGSRATSAGFYITIAADVAAMAPGTHLGSATPVTLGEEGEESENKKAMMRKATESMTAYVKTLAERRGRNVELSEKAVREGVSFTETEALRENLIDLVVPTPEELLVELNGRKIQRFDGTPTELKLDHPKTIAYDMSRRQRFLSFLADPNITVILFGLGVLGIMLELYNPGAILPGIVGVISLALCFLSAQILPINYIGVLLVLFAVVLFILELKVTSYGLLTIGGIVSFVLGATMLVEAPIPEMKVSLKVLALLVVLISATMIFLLGMVVSLHRKKPVTGVHGLMQEVGTAQTDIDGTGKVFVHGEIWSATSSHRIEKGSKVRILSVSGLTLQVEKVQNGSSEI